MKRWIVIVVAVPVVAIGLAGAALTVGLASVEGSINATGNVSKAIKETRVALLQGPETQALVRMGVIQPGTQVTLQGDNTIEWTTADRNGRFRFTGVRWAPASVVALREFEDGRICRTSDVRPSDARNDGHRAVRKLRRMLEAQVRRGVRPVKELHFGKNLQDDDLHAA